MNIRLFVLLVFFSTSNALAIELHFTGKTKIIQINPTHTSTATARLLTVFEFNINGSSFFYINGNNMDENISPLLIGHDEITFVIHDKNSKKNITPPREFQKRFIKCILSGMCSFMHTNLTPENIAIPTTSRTLKDIGIHKLVPTCSQLTLFLDSGETFFPVKTIRELEIKSRASEFKELSILEFHGCSFIFHEMIYIGAGIGFSKIGFGNIYFHTVDSIIHLYESDCSEPLIIKEYKKSKDDDSEPPPPPTAGASLAT